MLREDVSVISQAVVWIKEEYYLAMYRIEYLWLFT